MDASNTDSGTKLCSYCRKINFHALIREDPYPQRNNPFCFHASYDLGTTWDLLQRKDRCPLCYIFVLCLQEAFDNGVIPVAVGGGNTFKCELRENPVAFFPRGGSWMSVYKLNLSVEEELDARPLSLDEVDSLQSHSVELRFQAASRTMISSDLTDVKPVLPLRPRPLQYDFEQLKTWLRQCERAHGSNCSLPSRSYHNARAFRLVDASSRCIVDPSTLQNTLPRYLALSYVWGPPYAQKWRLTAESLEGAHKIGFLDTVCLARTISDAMEVVCMLGERYLWVDSLCIIQDSGKDKLEQIPIMGTIYEQAVATIVAASAKDADGGLPGVRPGTRRVLPHVFNTDELILVSAVETEFESLGSLKPGFWPTQNRKWTFQEGLLSRRCLIFSKEQVYWRCQCTTWSEEMLIQPTRDSAFLGWHHWPMSRRTININEVTNGSGANRDGENFALTYNSVVQSYSRRATTYPGDAMHAFQGVISFITRLTNVTFIWAIPQSGFDFYLLWDYNFTLGESRSTIMSHSETAILSASTIALFPSWSWLGWCGPVTTPDASQVPELECYVLDCGDDECSELTNTPFTRVHRDTHKDGIQSQPRRTRKNPIFPSGKWKRKDHTKVTAENISRLHITSPLVGRFHLFFWTSLASLFICCEDNDDGHGRGEDEEVTTLHLPVPKTKGSRASSGLKSTIRTTGPDSSPTVELEPGRQVEMWHRHNGPIPPAGTTSALHDFIVVGSALEYDRAMLTIMMISWNEAGIAQREFLTTISEEDWMEAERDWRLIVLG